MKEGATSPKEEPRKGEAWLLAGGVAAAGLGLAALVQGLKGANAPNASNAPASDQSKLGRPGTQIPNGIWAEPEPWPATTGNDWLDQQLGYAGGIKHRRRWP
jgi:hypothetical protein